ncbi:MAG: ISL3 family transposase [Acidimicrobiales bacterium]
MEIEGSGAVAVLGLEGFLLRAAIEEGGELWELVETTADFVGCPGCGTRARSKGRPTTEVRDMACGGRPVRLAWRKRRWRCPDADCDVKTWTETTQAIGPRAALTERARADICTRVGRDAASVSSLAREYGVAWSTAMAAVVSVGTPLIDDPGRIGEVRALGMDETSFLAANAAHHTTYVTGLVDLDRRRLVDVVEGNRAADVSRWLAGRPQEWLDAVAVACCDPHEGYRKAALAQLGGATLVADPFHIVALANRALDNTRRRVQQRVLGHRGRKADPLYRVRRVMLTGGERLSERGWERLEAGLVAGDPDDEVLDAWLAKEALRHMYSADTMVDAARRFDAFIREAKSSSVSELHRLAKTMSRWRTEVLAHHRTGASNGPTEAVNHLIKKVLRVAHAFRNRDNYRLRLLLHCGVEWQTPPATRIAGRSRTRTRPG